MPHEDNNKPIPGIDVLPGSQNTATGAQNSSERKPKKQRLDNEAELMRWARFLYSMYQKEKQRNLTQSQNDV